MKAMDILNFCPINETDGAHVAEIKKSIMANGWNGAPILVHEGCGMLITGSHRLAAIKDIYDNEWDFDLDAIGDVAESVDDIIENYCAENDCTIDEIPFDSLSLVFSKTWVEQYADEIVEW